MTSTFLCLLQKDSASSFTTHNSPPNVKSYQMTNPPNQERLIDATTYIYIHVYIWIHIHTYRYKLVLLPAPYSPLPFHSSLSKKLQLKPLHL